MPGEATPLRVWASDPQHLCLCAPSNSALLLPQGCYRQGLVRTAVWLAYCQGQRTGVPTAGHTVHCHPGHLWLRGGAVCVGERQGTQGLLPSFACPSYHSSLPATSPLRTLSFTILCPVSFVSFTQPQAPPKAASGTLERTRSGPCPWAASQWDWVRDTL
jgi:hypothetical protein